MKAQEITKDYSREKATRRKVIREISVHMSKNKIFFHIKTNFNIFKQETTWKANSYPLELIKIF